MRAVRLTGQAGLEGLHASVEPPPLRPGRGEITVRVHATSLNFHDYAVVSGMLQAPAGRIPMSDGAGVVEAIGDGVEEFSPGDHVVSLFFPDWPAGSPRDRRSGLIPGDNADGFAASSVTRPAHWFVKAPRGYSHVEAATLPTAGLTAWRALVTEGGIAAGETVLVMGTGGVSIFALQFARAMGARVIATSSSDEKLERLRVMGAQGLINYRETPDWGRRVLDLTDGCGVDHVVEIGGAATVGQSLIATRKGGSVWMIGILSGVAGEVPTGLMIANELRLAGISVGSRADQIAMIEALEINAIRPVIDSTFDLADIGKAFQHQIEGRHFGKIAITI